MLHAVRVIYHRRFITYKFKVLLKQFFLSASIFGVPVLRIICGEEPGVENEIIGKNYAWNIEVAVQVRELYQ
jgi:hypothetical protein